MAVQIELTRGYVTFVDDEDSDLATLKWNAHSEGGRKRPYARRNVIRGKGDSRYIEQRMHRIILERMLSRSLSRNELVDHKDDDPLNNRRSNLRLANHTTNNQNRGRPSDNTSGFKGVCWNKKSKKWQAAIGVAGSSRYLGLFATPEAAHEAYKRAAIEHYGEFANFGDTK